jgi:hypothetical protein
MINADRLGSRKVKGVRILLGRPGPMLDHWDGED